MLAARARQHRCALTPSEQKLWAAINAGQLGTWFRRQVPLGDYIADFVAPTQRLIIEVDGPITHARRSADARRDRKLARLGYRTLRLPAALVETNLQSALSRIRSALR
ncbi:MAG TPA: DUF559 domain-containing protein [Polyangiaceae bacterium]